MAVARFRNANNVLTIDQDYFNLALRSRGVVTTGAVQPASGCSFVTLTLPHDQSVLALNSASPVCVLYTAYGSGSVTYTLYAQGANVAIEYFNFDLPEYAAMNAADGKMIIRRPGDGRVAFDSRLPYIRVIDFVAQSLNDSTPNPYTTSYPGKKVAIIQAKRGYEVRSEVAGVGPPPLLVVVAAVSSFFKATGSTATIYKGINYSSFNTTTDFVTYNTKSPEIFSIVIDVTNF
jgi:hypothetical protein